MVDQRNSRTALLVFTSAILLALAVSGYYPVVLPRALFSSAPAGVTNSWNPNVNCTPTIVTVEQILGNQTNSLGGAAETGSIFNPGITSPFGPENTKRWLTPSASTPSGWVSPGPPCTITNTQGQIVSAFVQINGVERGFRAEEDWNSSFMPVNGGTHYTNGPQSDTTFNILTPGYSPCSSSNTTGCMHTLHSEIDHDWKGANYCGPNTACDNSALVAETGAYSSLIDVQGFVFWDPDHLNESAHNFSGWELHPLTAWRLSGLSSDYALSASPSIVPVMPGLSASSTITVNTFNLFTGNLSFTTTVTPWLTASGPNLVASLNPSTVFISPGATGSSKLTLTSAPSNTGNFTVGVIGTNGTLTRSVTVTAYVTDFNIAASPSSVSISIGSSGQSTLTIGSINDFTGNVSLTVQVNPSSLTAGLSPSPPTATLGSPAVSVPSQGTSQDILTLSASLLTTPGTYTVTVTAIANGVSHVATVTLTVTVAGII